MSGHSKWHNIQGKKGKADKARSNVFTKIARMVSVAVQQGAGDVNMNFSLRLAIEKAKAANMPKDNIERAIKNGLGELADGVTVKEVVYEGFGPLGTAFLVEALTDNPNRTVSEVKNTFSKHGGNMASTGAVKWQFNHLGVIRLAVEQSAKIKDKMDEFELELMDSGAEDIIKSEYGLEIRCAVDKFQKVSEVLKKYNLEAESAGLEWVSKESVTLSDEDSERVSKLVDFLDDLDDVKEVYTNEA